MFNNIFIRGAADSTFQIMVFSIFPSESTSKRLNMSSTGTKSGVFLFLAEHLMLLSQEDLGRCCRVALCTKTNFLLLWPTSSSPPALPSAPFLCLLITNCRQRRECAKLNTKHSTFLWISLEQMRIWSH